MDSEMSYRRAEVVTQISDIADDRMRGTWYAKFPDGRRGDPPSPSRAIPLITEFPDVGAPMPFRLKRPEYVGARFAPFQMENGVLRVGRMRRGAARISGVCAVSRSTHCLSNMRPENPIPFGGWWKLEKAHPTC